MRADSIGVLPALVLLFCTPSTMGLVPALRPLPLQQSSPLPRAQRQPRMGSPVYPVPFSTREYLKQREREKQTLARKWIDAGVPRWVTLIDEGMFVIGSIIFVVGSLDFYPGVPIGQYIEGCQLFIIGSLIFLSLALFASYEIVEDAELQKREPDLWLLGEQALYVVGSSLFAVGTVLFTPQLSEDVAPPAAVAADPDAAVDVVSVRWFGKVYEIVQGGGAVGGPEVPDSLLQTGDVLFAVGSVLYAVAAFVSALRAAGDTNSSSPEAAVRRRTAVATASLYELGGVAFVVGTLGFIPASTLGIGACPEGSVNMLTFGANLFVLGSMLYTAGSALTFGVTTFLTYFNDAPPRGDAAGVAAAGDAAAGEATPSSAAAGSPVGAAESGRESA